jgi:hypothetical protein
MKLALGNELEMTIEKGWKCGTVFLATSERGEINPTGVHVTQSEGVTIASEILDLCKEPSESVMDFTKMYKIKISDENEITIETRFNLKTSDSDVWKKLIQVCGVTEWNYINKYCAICNLATLFTFEEVKRNIETVLNEQLRVNNG